MLYPERAWHDSGEDAQYMRGMFIVNMPVPLHVELHKKINKKLGIEITANHIPEPRYLRIIAQSIRVNEDKFEQYTPVKKLAWLKKTLECIPHSRYLDVLLRSQISFLKKHEGEY